MTNPTIMQEIQSLLNNYFDALYTQDLTIFDQVFHKDSVLYNAQDGNTVIRPIAEYREVVKNRKSPKEMGSPRNDNVVLIDFLSSEMAMVKVRLRLYDNIMEDYLNLIKSNGRWQVAAKMWTKVGPA
jgi:hypothetical protein